jgi:hypothetical protein
VFLSISSVGLSLHFILVFLSISSVGVAGSFMCWCFSPFHLSVFFSYFIYRCCWQLKLPATPIDKIEEKHRQMKWRETPTDEMERNTDT